MIDRKCISDLDEDVFSRTNPREMKLSEIVEESVRNTFLCLMLIYLKILIMEYLKIENR